LSLFVAASALSVVAVVVVAEFELPRTQIRHRLHAGFAALALANNIELRQIAIDPSKGTFFCSFFSVFFFLF
jgi:hypothetical protein